MGTINYGTSDYITLGIKPYSSYDFENDADFMKEIREQCAEYGGTIENAIDEYIEELYNSDYANAETIIEKYRPYYFHVSINHGYYEGLYIDIENNFGVFLDDYTERAEMQKEITQIKHLLTELAGVGFVACFPGWVTGYSDYKGTLAGINDAIKEMRNETKTIPTYKQYIA